MNLPESPSRPPGWERLAEETRDRIIRVDVAEDRRESYEASVVLVTYDRAIENLKPTLESLTAQDTESFEVLLLDNGTEWDLHGLQVDYEVVTVYVEFDRNYGVNLARNTGAAFANGQVLVFLDDDAVPRDDFVSQHLRAHQNNDIVGARGRVLSKSAGFFNRMGPRYDIGDESFPHPLDLEGNLSIDSDAFAAVGGFDEDIFGHEGLDLTVRLIERYDPEETIYYPDAVIRHDFVDGFFDYVEKRARHRHYRQQLSKRRPELFKVYDYYEYEPQDSSDDSITAKITLYAIKRIADALARLNRMRRSFDRPTR